MTSWVLISQEWLCSMALFSCIMIWSSFLNAKAVAMKKAEYMQYTKVKLWDGVRMVWKKVWTYFEFPWKFYFSYIVVMCINK